MYKVKYFNYECKLCKIEIFKYKDDAIDFVQYVVDCINYDKAILYNNTTNKIILTYHKECDIDWC